MTYSAKLKALLEGEDVIRRIRNFPEKLRQDCLMLVNQPLRANVLYHVHKELISCNVSIEVVGCVVKHQYKVLVKCTVLRRLLDSVT
jgi:hypothetical protein